MTRLNLLEKVGRTVSTQELLPLLATYQMMPQFLIQTILDRAIQSIACTSEETLQACQQLCQRWSLTTEAQQQDWRSHYGLSAAEFEQLATRSLRIEKFQQQTWAHQINSYFLQRKQDLDQVVYSLLRTSDEDMAQELYFRISEDEASFAELALQYSEGIERQTGGLLGPIELGALHQQLAQLLYTSPIGHVQTFRLGDWCMIVRLEKRVPAQLDESVRQRLLQEKFETWLQTQIQQLSDRDKVWLGVSQPIP
ncbi:peptidylprolyl isomerase [Leptolyngbya ohadii]|uniref:peptidylprolyl isomerase n=1 Tax=Leptolyngbya ohadii TaxID=1962290 RepID=UPI000B59F2F0|nr:peptidylprolyl isomerase [Leptolyngbya ohadii]